MMGVLQQASGYVWPFRMTPAVGGSEDSKQAAVDPVAAYTKLHHCFYSMR